MPFFQNIPNIEYLIYKKTPFDGDKVIIKDIFRKVYFAKLSEKYSNNFVYYNVKNGERPDVIAYDFYGNSFYDWVILMSNPEINNVYEDWAKSNEDLDNYILQKYNGKEFEIKHYETLEIRNLNNEIILSSGIIVNQDFSFSFNDLGVSRTLTGSDVVKSVTYYDYEVSLNEKRSLIRLLKPELLDIFLIENEKLLNYDTNDIATIDNKLKTTLKDLKK